MQRERFGRMIGIAGAACAAVLWAVLLGGCAVVLLQPPSGLAGLVVLAAVPLALFASMLLVVSIIDVVVLARRVDRGNPWRVASVHVVMAIVVLAGERGAPAWLAAGALLAIAATQVLALRCFAQITPSHTSSQR